MKFKTIHPIDVEHLPETLEEGILYICESFALVAHKCCCGCGEEVITPLNEARWRLMRRGEVVSLYPSIGNWKFECQSHYWIENNRVLPARAMSSGEIRYVQDKDQRDRERYIASVNNVRRPEKLVAKFRVWKEAVFRWVRMLIKRV